MKKYLIQTVFVFSALSVACTQQSTSPNANNKQRGSEQSTASTSTGTNEPCMLITKDDASEALGGQVKVSSSPPTTSGSKKTLYCSYTTPRTGLLDVHVYTPLTAAEFEAGKGREEANSANKIQTLSGIGDQAFIVGREGRATISFLKGNAIVQIGLLDLAKVPPGAHPDKSLKAFSEDLKKLAIKAASRME